jgi:CubicO group peptidase (beta-lactamase class C family)
MSSGLKFIETYQPGDDATAMLFVEPSAADYAARAPLQHRPGEHFSYSSGTTNLLAKLFQQQVDGGLQGNLEYLYRELYQPLGMQHSLFEVDPSGGFVGSSYLYASARDWARIGQLMLGDGVINDQRLLEKNWIERATSPNHSANEQAYGYQFWLNSGAQPRWPSLPADAYAALGNRKQVMMMVPSEDLLILRLGWSPGSYPTDENFAQLLVASAAVDNLTESTLSTE